MSAVIPHSRPAQLALSLPCSLPPLFLHMMWVGEPTRRQAQEIAGEGPVHVARKRKNTEVSRVHCVKCRRSEGRPAPTLTSSTYGTPSQWRRTWTAKNTSQPQRVGEEAKRGGGEAGERRTTKMESGREKRSNEGKMKKEERAGRGLSPHQETLGAREHTHHRPEDTHPKRATLAHRHTDSRPAAERRSRKRGTCRLSVEAGSTARRTHVRLVEPCISHSETRRRSQPRMTSFTGQACAIAGNFLPVEADGFVLI